MINDRTDRYAERNDASSDRSSRATRRSTGTAVRVPRVTSDRTDHWLAGQVEPHLGYGGLAEDHDARMPQPRGEITVCRGRHGIPGKVAGAEDGRKAGCRSAQILHQEGHAGEWRGRIEPRQRCPSTSLVDVAERT